MGEMAEAIPPAFGEFIGSQVIQFIERLIEHGYAATVAGADKRGE
jgi:hypothetical protein